VTAGNARHGRRNNGLFAAEYAVVGDVDPRVGEHLLDVLGNRGIAAYLQPSADQHPITRITTLPGRPVDRLFVDRRELTTAREFYTLATEEMAGAVDPDGLSAAVSSPPHDADRVGIDFESAWASIVASFDAPRRDGPAPWPACEDDGRWPGRLTISSDGGPASPAAGPVVADTSGISTSDRSSTLRTGGDRTTSDQPGSDRTTSDQPGSDRAATDNRDTDRGDTDPRDTGRSDTNRSDTARSDRPAPGHDLSHTDPTVADTRPDGTGIERFDPTGLAGLSGFDPTGTTFGADLFATSRPAERPSRRRTDPTTGDDSSLLDGLDTLGANASDDDEDENYHPPAPPPLPRFAGVTVIAVLGIVIGIAVLISPSLLPVSTSTAAILGCAGIVGGGIALIARLRPGDDDDPDDPDQGAVV
jgi:hypothetical protein